MGRLVPKRIDDDPHPLILDRAHSLLCLELFVGQVVVINLYALKQRNTFLEAVRRVQSSVLASNVCLASLRDDIAVGLRADNRYFPFGPTFLFILVVRLQQLENDGFADRDVPLLDLCPQAVIRFEGKFFFAVLAEADGKALAIHRRNHVSRPNITHPGVVIMVAL